MMTEEILHGVFGAGAGGMTVVDSLTEFLDPIVLYKAQLIERGLGSIIDGIEHECVNREELAKALIKALESHEIEPKQLKVDLFEAQKRIGGHVESKTYQGTEFPSELGPEFIHGAYLLLKKRLDSHNIQLKEFYQSFAIYYEKDNTHITFPPVLPTLNAGSGCASLCSSEGSCLNSTQPNLTFDPVTLTTHWTDLLAMGELMLDAHALKTAPEEIQTLQQYAGKFCEEHSAIPESTRRAFVDMVLYPLVAASWGIKIDEAKSMCAHYALTYLALGLKWYEVIGGLEQSITKVKEDALAQPNMSIHNGVIVKQLLPVRDNKQAIKGYQILAESADGKTQISDKVYDSVSLGMNLKDLIPVLQELANSEPDVADFINLCKKVQYYKTKVVFHRDPDFIPSKHTVVNIHFDGNQRAATTIFKDFHAKTLPNGEKDFSSVVMKSWVFPEMPEPKNQLGSKEFEHPLMDIHYYIATQALKRLIENRPDLKFDVVSIAGGFNDANESAIHKATEHSARMLRDNGLPLTRILKDNQEVPDSTPTQHYHAKKSPLWLDVKAANNETRDIVQKCWDGVIRMKNSFFQCMRNKRSEHSATETSGCCM